MPAADIPKDQPLSNIEWVDPATLQANNYNPNKVAGPEMKLLKRSIMEDGWTQPIVAMPTGEIVDGFHRWTLGSTDDDIRAMSNNLVPVVRIAPDPAQQRMATIRHNRARGSHHVLKMADIVAELRELGVDDEAIGQRLGMEPEEVTRLLSRGSKKIRHADTQFSQAWKPAPTYGEKAN